MFEFAAFEKDGNADAAAHFDQIILPGFYFNCALCGGNKGGVRPAGFYDVFTRFDIAPAELFVVKFSQ